MASNEEPPKTNSDDSDSFDDDETDCYEWATIKELNPDKKEKIAEGVLEYTIGEHTEQTELLPEKAILVVGGTRKGKSTLINRMINHILGIKYADKFRYQLVQEKKMSQTESQTRDITKYTLLNLKKFKLIIIDTPGIGDTAGKEEDQKIIDKIKALCISGTIKTVDAICFVAKYNDVRLDEHVSYVFDAISQLFGKDTKKNIFVMATCCDATYDDENKIERAPVLKLFKKAKIPFKECFPFNNKNIYKKPETGGTISYREQEDWKTSAISFNRFFKELQKIFPVSLALTKEIMEKRHYILHVQLPNFITQLRDNIHSIYKHKENLKGIEKEIENPTKHFTYEVEIEKIIQVDIKEPGIFCVKCKTCYNPDKEPVCHYPCGIQKNDDLWWCDAMSWWTWQLCAYCKMCPKSCRYTDHFLDKKRPVRRTVKEKLTLEDLKVKYFKGKGGSRDNLVKLIEYEMVSAYDDMLKDLEGIQECIDFINDKCLSKKTVTLESYVDDIIKRERENEEDGYLKRIKVLKNLIAITKEANKQKFNVFEAFKQASKEDKLQQAQRCFKD